MKGRILFLILFISLFFIFSYSQWAKSKEKTNALIQDEAPVTLYLSQGEKYLTISPETGGSSYQDAFSSGYETWTGTNAISGDISGTDYTFNIYAASQGTTTFRADLKINGQLVASIDFTASSTTFLPKGGTVTGIDPDLSGTSTVTLEIHHTGGDMGIILSGDFGPDDSYLILPGSFTVHPQLAASTSHTVGLKSNGTCIGVGRNDSGNLNFDGWYNIVQVSCGKDHTAGLKSDGTVVAVGGNEFGQCNVGSWTDIIQAASGGYHTVGLKSDGTVVAVGRNNDGRCNVSGWTDIIEVAAWDYIYYSNDIGHTVGLRSDGTCAAVGDNSAGQCNVDSWTDIIQVSAGGNYGGGFTVGLKSDGTVVSVGNNSNFQYIVVGWTDVVQVSAGNYHIVGLKSDGTVLAAGISGNVGNLLDIVQVAAGLDCILALKSDGTVAAVGGNLWGQCHVKSWKDITKLEAGIYSRGTIGLKSDGTLVCVGYYAGYHLDIYNWTDITQVASSFYLTIGLKSDNTVKSDGWPLPEINNWTDIVKVDAGYQYAVGLKSDGTCAADGNNDYGQCDVSGWTGIEEITTGYHHTVGVKPDGTCVAVGYNSKGQCDVGTWTDIEKVAAGVQYTVGLKSDGTCVAVGYNNKGQCDVSGWTDVVHVVCGVSHTVGLKSDGTCFAVGSPNYIDGVESWTDIVDVTVGEEHTVGLKSDGTFVTAGNNNRSQCNLYDWHLSYIPVLNNPEIENVSYTSASIGGKVIISPTNITERGIYWSTVDGFSIDEATKVSESGNWPPGCTFSINPDGLPSDTKIYSRTFATNSFGSGYSIQDSFTTLSPDCEINIKHGTNNIPDGGFFDFGTVEIGNTSDGIFTLENTGTGNLVIFGNPIITISGPDADRFNVQQQPISPVEPGNCTVFTIRFHPLTVGSKTAYISIENSDINENPYDVTLIGTGQCIIPIITAHPQDQTIDYNTSAALSAAANGTEPLSYQWYRGNTGDTSNPVGSNSNSYTTPNLTGTTSYWVRVSNNCGSVDSNTAVITVNPAPEPEMNVKVGTADILDEGIYDFGSIVVGDNEDVIFTIENTGTADLIFGGAPIISITGPNADQFSVEQRPVSPVPPGNFTVFTLRFSPTSGDAKTASISIVNNDADENPYDITLTGTGQCISPTITAHPRGQTIDYKTSAALSVTANGSEPLSYQWYQGNTGETSNPVGSNSNSYTTPGLTETTSYWVMVSNICGPVESDTAIITVNPPTPIELISPNGGEVWEVGSSHNITWTSPGHVENIKIEYSIDNGSTWIEIVDSTSNDGTYNWIVPAQPSDRCLIRICPMDSDIDPLDVSDNVFSIISDISSCGENWSLSEYPGNDLFKSAAYGNFLFTAVGAGGVIYTSINGNSWTGQSSGTTTDLNGITFGNSMFAAVGNSGVILTSPNGTDWTVRTSGTSNALYGITCGNGRFAAVGSTGTILTSTDGVNWTTRTPGTSGTLHGISWGNNIYIAVGNDGTVLTSSNGINWDPQSIRGTDNLHDITYGSNRFVVVGDTGTILSSPDGNEWSIRVSGISINLTGIGFGASKFVTVGDYGVILTSLDSIEWNNCSPGVNNNLADVIYGNSRFAAVGTGTIFYSQCGPGNPTIRVTSPNGGEILPVGSTHNITWDSTGIIDNVKIEYSIDSGTSWTGIIDAALNNGIYEWAVPDAISGNCLIRTSDLDDEPADESDDLFSIAAASTDTITVTSPNGGESLDAGSIHEISWTTEGTIGNVKIDYSTDGGTSWNNIVLSTENDGFFNWTVPDYASENCLVRISEDDEDGEPRDVSDAEFSINYLPPASITVTSPNGGESLSPGTIHEITWTGTGTFNSVKIEFSADKGRTWTDIESNSGNDGIYEWLVPGYFSVNCLVRVTGKDSDNEASDVSDDVFSIVSPIIDTITITSPNGGENLFIDSIHGIKWISTGTIENVKIEYSPDNGFSWIEIISSTSNSGSFDWTVPDNPSDNTLIRVSDIDGDPTDVSNGVFSIILPPSITITSPNGGESWEAGTYQDITWISTGIESDVRIEYSIDNGDTWIKVISSTGNDGSFQWLVPDEPSENCLMRISDISQEGGALDISDNVFSITTQQNPKIIVTSPNGGESLFTNSTHTITWTSTGTVDNVKIEYSVDNGNTWTGIIDSISNEGNYDWPVPDNPSDNCMIRISDISGDPWDTSDTLFSIVSPSSDTITVTSPNGGEVFDVNSTQQITWTSTGTFENVMIDFSTDNGDSWATIVSSTTNDGSYEWTVQGITSENCLVRISSSDEDKEPSDTSDAVFSIVNPLGTIKVTSPNGAENLGVGSTHEITWIYTGDIESVIIEYSTDSGINWTNIVKSSENDGKYEWIVPDTPSDNCLVRISSSDIDGGVSDVSDGIFSIISPGPDTLTVSSPNGGEKIHAGTPFPVKWIAGKSIENVKLEYSTDNGSTYLPINNRVSNTGFYEWQVPYHVSTNCIIRISEAGSFNPQFSQLLYETRFRIEKLNNSNTNEKIFSLLLGNAENPVNNISIPGISIISDAKGKTYLEFNDECKEIQNLYYSWHQLRMILDQTNKTLSILLNEKPFFENIALSHRYEFNPAISLYCNSLNSTAVEIDDLSLQVHNSEKKKYYLLFQEGFETFKIGKFPGSSGWRTVRGQKVEGQRLKDLSNVIEIVENPGTRENFFTNNKVLRIEKEGGNRILLIKQFKMPENFPFDISDKNFEIRK